MLAAASISLEPVLPAESKITELLHLIQSDPNSPFLEEEFTWMEFPLILVCELRRDYILGQLTGISMFDRMKKCREDIIQERADNLELFVESHIIHGTMSFQQALMLSVQPDVIKRLERKWKLPITGDFHTLRQNYTQTKYTRQCFTVEGMDPIFCLRGAAQWGHLDVAETAIAKGVTDDYGGNAYSLAAQYGHRNIMKLLLERKVSTYRIENIMYAERFGHTDIADAEFELLKPEEYRDLVYYPLGGYDLPRLAEMVLKKNPEAIVPNEVAKEAARYGAVEMVKYMLTRGANNYEEIMFKIARHDNGLEIVQMMLERGATNFNRVLLRTVKYFQHEIVDLMLEKGANNYNEAFTVAFSSDCPRLTRLFSQHVTDITLLNQGLLQFISGCLGDLMYKYETRIAQLYDDPRHEEYMKQNRQTVYYLINRGANNFDDCLVESSKWGIVEFVQLFLDLGAVNYNQAMLKACNIGAISVVQILLNKRANNFNECALESARKQRVSLVYLFLQKGADNYSEILLNLVNGPLKLYLLDSDDQRNQYVTEYSKLIKLLLIRGANNHDEALELAKQRNCVHAINAIQLFLQTKHDQPV